MALINCPECGKQISDRSRSCIHCGYPLDLKENNTIFNHQRNIKQKLMSLKTDILQVVQSLKYKKAILVILALIILAVGIITISVNSFSSEEKYGLKMVSKYQEMLKNPDSLVLRSDIAVISYSRDEKTYKYVFFDTSGDNSYGASVTSTPCFVDGQYICDSDEIPTTSEYMSMSDAKAKEYLGIELALAHWRLYGEDADEEKEDVTDAYSVSAKKIARKLDIKCNVD